MTRLGLIGMSGVRAQNEELMAFGLTLPGFVERSQVIASLPSLGLLTLAALTPSSWDVRYLEAKNLAEGKALPTDFDLVGISSLSAQVREAYSLVDHYRSRGVRVVLGGLHVSALPEEALRHADAVVVGEGEPSWPRVCADFERGELQRVYRSARQFDLADAPLPRFDLLDLDRYNRITVQTSRGCPFRCEFCAASMRIAPHYQVKPVPKVLAEIRSIKQRWARPFIEFADDNSFVNRKHSKELLRALIPEGIRYFTESDISIAGDDDLLELLRASGCVEVLIGLESPSAAPLEGLEQSSNWKRKRFDGYRRAVERIQGHGIAVNGCFVLGLDGSDTGSFDAIFEFSRAMGLFDVQITVLTPFPGTPLYERLRREGRLLDEDAWEQCTLFDVNFRPQNMTVSELERGLRDLGARLYSQEFTEERRHHFLHQYREARRQ